jgi:peptide deformylase
LEIILTGDPRLKEICREISTEEIKSEYVQNLITGLIETASQEKDALGLAASQVGEIVRLFVMRTGLSSHVTPLAEKPFEVMINPVITKVYPKKVYYREGCLSEPDISAVIERSQKIKVKYLDEHGNNHRIFLQDYDAIVFQHEYDHLDGKLMTDVAIKVNPKDSAPSADVSAAK